MDYLWCCNKLCTDVKFENKLLNCAVVYRLLLYKKQQYVLMSYLENISGIC